MILWKYSGMEYFQRIGTLFPIRNLHTSRLESNLKTARWLACLSLLAFVTAGVWLSGSAARAKPMNAARTARRNALQAELRQVGEVFRAGEYHEALRRFGEGYEKALAQEERDWAARFLGNVGACRFALYEYQAALDAFQRASRMAAENGDPSAAAALDVNISSLYAQIGETDAAAEWIEKSLPKISGYDRQDHLPKVHIQLAVLRARQGRMAEAEALFRKGIAGADRNGDLALYALGWNRLGDAYLLDGNLAAAEPALLEAYRVRKLHRLVMDSSLLSLGHLRQQQGDLASAEALLSIAAASARSARGATTMWYNVYHRRGHVRLAQGRGAEALEDLRAAVRLARVWRFSGPPDDAARVGAEVMLDEVYSALIEAATLLYRKSHREDLLRESFEAAEENRAASLRALTVESRKNRRELAPEYWDTLAKLEAAETEAVRTGAADQARIASLRAELIRLEVRPGSNPEPEVNGLCGRLRRVLRDDEAMLSFQLGERESYLWAVDRRGLQLHTLPARRELARQARACAYGLRDGSGGANCERLYGGLFGALDARWMRQPRWLLALDRDLFGVPFAGLVAQRRGEKAVYLAESHAVQVVPGAAWLVLARENRPADYYAGPFLGVADPIYNTADARWHGGSAQAAMPRLPASAGEARSCAAAWGGAGVVLSGAQASHDAVRRALANRPAVAHFATHVLESGERPRHGLIALSLSPRGQPELLTPREIGGWTAGPALVVLSGCSSGAGDALPGAGLMGLTRAWLAAGTRAVAASYWPTADDSGSLFLSFYHQLRRYPRAGASWALRNAQLEMLRAGDWRSAPRYWGAYFVTGSD
jgi:tetratricopeptide (TPR) repeat protein